MDKAGNLWIGTDGGGINVFNKGRRIAIYNADNKKFRSNTVQAALCDSKGGLWFGLFYGGIAYYTPRAKASGRFSPKTSHALTYVPFMKTSRETFGSEPAKASIL